MALCYGVPEIGVPRLLQRALPSVGGNLASEIFWWALAAGMLGYVSRVECRSLASIGLRAPTWRSLAWGAAASIVLIAGFPLVYFAILPALGLHGGEAQTARIMALPYWLRCLIVLRAGIVEEVLYRGIPIERLSELTGRRWLAAGVSVLVFTAAHYQSWGLGHLLFVVWGAALLAGLYLWRRDLACNMIAHVLADAIGFLSG